MANQSLIKKILIGVIILLVVLFIIFLSWRYVFFNLIDENPDSNTLPTSQTTLVYTFNHTLNKTSIASVKGLDVKYRVNINDKQLRIFLLGTVGKNRNVSVLISASSGDTNLKITRTYTTKYVTFKNLSKEEQQRQISESSGVEKDYPLVKQLPIITPDFEIDYIVPDKSETIMSLNILCKNPDFNNLLGDEKISDNTSCLSDAEKYLSNIGYDKSKYVLLNDIKTTSNHHHD